MPRSGPSTLGSDAGKPREHGHLPTGPGGREGPPPDTARYTNNHSEDETDSPLGAKTEWSPQNSMPEQPSRGFGGGRANGHDMPISVSLTVSCRNTTL